MTGNVYYHKESCIRRKFRNAGFEKGKVRQHLAKTVSKLNPHVSCRAWDSNLGHIGVEDECPHFYAVLHLLPSSFVT